MSEMAAVKIKPDMIKPFRGNVGDDVEAWIQKIELVGSLTGVKDMACFWYCYLEIDVLSIGYFVSHVIVSFMGLRIFYLDRPA